MSPQMQPHMSMRQRMMKGVRRMQDVYPRWLSQYPIIVYILALTVVSFMYSAYSLPWYYMLSGVVAVLIFFLFGNTVTKSTSIDIMHSEKRFKKRIFLIAFIPRLLFMLMLYWIFQANYGDAFGFDNADAQYYHDLGEFVSGLISKGNFHFYDEITRWCGRDDISDMGYGIYVGFIYWLTGNSIVVLRIIKCILSALTVLLIYRLAKRNFGGQTARIAAVFMALWPNFWYYCGTHLKEVEMVFMGVLFVEQADQMLRSRKFSVWKVVPILLMAAALYTMRTPLAIVALLSLIFSVVMSSAKVVSWGKRIVVGLLAVSLIGITMGNRIEEESRVLLEASRTNQDAAIEHYATRKDASGNQQRFAKYAGAAVFAPLIFTLPFPTMVRPYDGQEAQQLLNGGNFIKNIISGFTILALVILLMSGRWREHLVPLSYMSGYLVVLVMSAFAHSERFHEPAMPFELMFAAYGLSIAMKQQKYKRWFSYWCGVMFIAAIVWNWFKLTGRGLA